MLGKIYRPKADDPRPYRELLGRLGRLASNLPRSIWLAGHGCDAEPELSEAEEAIRAYQDSPQRAADARQAGAAAPRAITQNCGARA